ncbi:cysteine desulfuration protein SufE [Roseibium sp. TrichSKD4]|uniref:SufE family protein n=1 Tax=Roseibium sp. TrichSKD4 TaxID=744980 RepID=UPI0001E57255|nr:SufE family protein [Roseibium sp. TrichSKD4]EFO29063.1 cysteine desulfuration protein SufE [Roseibium sp. TrichSKD4]
MTTSLDDIVETFDFLDDWEDRYKYLIDLGKELPGLADDEKNESNKVRGCVSQVWLVTEVDRSGEAPVLTYRGDSDALIVQGLVAVALAVFSGKTAQDVLATDVDAIFNQLGLQEHLTPQRSNGLKSMIGRIRADAEAALRSEDA